MQVVTREVAKSFNGVETTVIALFIKNCAGEELELDSDAFSGITQFDEARARCSDCLPVGRKGDT